MGKAVAQLSAEKEAQIAGCSTLSSMSNTTRMGALYFYKSNRLMYIDRSLSIAQLKSDIKGKAAEVIAESLRYQNKKTYEPGFIVDHVEYVHPRASWGGGKRGSKVFARFDLQLVGEKLEVAP